MVYIEILSVVLSVLLCFNVFSKHKANTVIYLVIVVLIGVLCIQQQLRWQLYPLILAILSIAIITFLKPKLKVFNVLSRVVAFVLLAITAVLIYILPVVDLPQPTGTYSVGVKDLYFENENGRKLTVTAWYPSNEYVNNPKLYYSQDYNKAFAQSKGLPSFLFSHLNGVKSHSQYNLKLVPKQQFPVVVFSHGYLWNVALYSSIIEELTSNGYVVFGIDHTYETPLTKFKDESIYWNQSLMDDMYQGLDFNRYKQLESEFLSATNETDKLKIMQNIMTVMTYSESLSRWSDDIAFVIDTLTKEANTIDSFWHQNIDTNHIALVGHSWGGAAVVEHATETNHAIKAVANLDGAQWGNVINKKLNVPLLALYADRDYNSFFTPNFFVYNHISNNALYEAIIKGSAHANFGDLSYWFNLNSTLTETGSIDAKRMTSLTNQLLLNFLDTYLKEKENNLELTFSNTTQYPELQFKKLK